jgi:chemotaxis protein CheD
MDEQKTVAVGIGELYVTGDPTLVLAAYGLGSCIGLSLYDPIAKVGGLAHVLLPSSKEANHQTSSCKFADIAVPELIRALTKAGAQPRRMICKIAGGAQMLAMAGHTNGNGIGHRNAEAVGEALKEFRISPSTAQTGGSQGRTLRLVVGTGQVFVRTAGQTETEI